MAKKNRNDNGGMVYSTGKSITPHGDDDDQAAISPEDQLLYVSIDRKQRKGKEVTLIEGFKGTDSNRTDLAKTLKSKCGTGGTAKDGDIIIQGNFRDKIILMLEAEGFRVKRKGG